MLASGNAISWNIVQKNLNAGYTVKERLARKIAGLAKLLVHFPPETMHLQVVIEKLPKKGIHTAKLTLRLPSNILHAEKSEADLLHAIDAAIHALEREVKSLKAELRGDYRWKRPAWRARLNEEKAILFSEPMDEGAGPQTDADVVADLLAAHDGNLLAHARRALQMAELADELPQGAVDARDVVDEAARVCLAHPEGKPSGLTHEQWFYRLIREEIDRQLRRFAEESRLRAPLPEDRPSASDEAEGYDAEHPLDLITREIEPEEDLPEERLPDPSVAPPDTAVSSRELIEMLQREVKNWPPIEREIFELHYMVGLDLGDIAMIRHHPEKDIEALAGKVQLRLRDFLRDAATTRTP
jgi:DNA-directed RNA polymerase specialized sigma24 family protein/ribosome-associated translation inhibitor RaiA